MSTALCDAFYHGVESAKVMCSDYCCGIETYRYCCSECNLHYPFDSSACSKPPDSSHIEMAIITSVVIGVAAILFICASLRYTRIGQKLCFRVSVHRPHQESPLENPTQPRVQPVEQNRQRNPRMSPYSLLPPSLLPPLPVYEDVGDEEPPPAFEEEPISLEEITMTSIIPLPQPAVLHDPECASVPGRPPPAYTSFSGPPTSGPPVEHSASSQRQ